MQAASFNAIAPTVIGQDDAQVKKYASAIKNTVL